MEEVHGQNHEKTEQSEEKTLNSFLTIHLQLLRKYESTHLHQGQ